MTKEELRDYVDEQRTLDNIPYHVYSELIDGIDTLEQEPCDNCKYLDGDGCRLVFEQIEYGKASDECPSDNNVSTKNTVSRGVFEQVMWERDIAISQLKKLGYEFGQKVEPCEDTISRQAVLNLAKKGVLISNGNYKSVCKAINELPSVNLMPCEDVIRRQAVLDIVDSYSESQSNVEDVTQDIISDIVVLPSVNPTKTGHWIMTGDYYTGAYVNIDYVECSCCNEYSLEKGNYCPNCGARMIESKEVRIRNEKNHE